MSIGEIMERFEMFEKDRKRVNEIDKAFKRFWDACNKLDKSIDMDDKSVLKARKRWFKVSNELIRKMDREERRDTEKMKIKLKEELKHVFETYVSPKDISILFDYALVSPSYDGYYAMVNKLKIVTYDELDKLNKRWRNPVIRVVDGYIEIYLRHTKY